MDADTKKRREALEDYIRKNPHSSTLEQQQLEEIEKGEQKENSKPGDVR
jgi:hypothetical protein